MSRIIEKEKTPITKALFRVMGGCYRFGVGFRHFTYDWIFPPFRLKKPVISIGNIVAGGSGKTPFVQYLAESLFPKKVAILSRGYKRKGKKPIIVSKDAQYEECGDEPLLLAQKLPQSIIAVHANRAYAGILAQTYDPDIFLLDDGMQHRQLHRDYEVIVMDAENLFGKGHFLPLGYLRDHPKRLSKANVLVINGIRDEEHLSQIEPFLRKYTRAPLVCMQRVVQNRADIASKKVALFCGIAAPYRFTNTLKTLGCDIVIKEEKPDHDPFTLEELERFANLAKSRGAECLVCTEKDAIKLPNNIKLQLPIIAVRIILKPLFGKEHLDTLIREVNT